MLYSVRITSNFPFDRPQNFTEFEGNHLLYFVARGQLSGMVFRLQSLFGDKQCIRERIDIKCAGLYDKTVAASQVRIFRTAH